MPLRHDVPMKMEQMRSPTRRGFLRTLAARAADGAVLPEVAAGPVTESQEVLNVRNFGAVGDGKADDTNAFHNALAAAAKLLSGRTVVVPGGSYRLTSSLNITSALLLGQFAGGWPADSRPMPTLLVDMPAPEACIIAHAGASVHGITLAFATKNDPKREFGPTVLLKGGAGEAYNVANPHGECSIAELADRLAALYAGKGVTVERKARVDGVYMPSPILATKPDIAKARALGWQPRYGIEEGFARTVDSYLQ